MKSVTYPLMAMVLLFAAGCEAKKCGVAGKVTRDGKALEWETEGGRLLLIFFPLDREANKDVYAAETDRVTGGYTIAALPVGNYRVAVQQFDEHHVDALGHVYNPSVTPLRAEVKEDGQRIDFDLPKDLPKGGGGPAKD